MPTGVILKGIGGFYYVKAGDSVYECKARGVFRKDDLVPLPGDVVEVSVISEDRKEGVIAGILDRKSQLTRPSVANVDQLAAVVAVRSPYPDLTLLDKLLITAGIKGIGCIVCVNKIDLDEEGDSEKISYSYRKAGYPVVLLNSINGTGFENLRNHLNGKVTVFAGQSGVGKSTILNRLFNSSIMKTGEVSEKIKRGKHTTRHAELVELDSGGFVVDTPGFSSFELTGLKPAELQLFYPEFGSCVNRCKFTGCSHISEPGCGVKQMLEEGLIDRGRYERYVQFYNALKQEKGLLKMINKNEKGKGL